MFAWNVQFLRFCVIVLKKVRRSIGMYSVGSSLLVCKAATEGGRFFKISFLLADEVVADSHQYGNSPGDLEQPELRMNIGILIQ